MEKEEVGAARVVKISPKSVLEFRFAEFAGWVDAGSEIAKMVTGQEVVEEDGVRSCLTPEKVGGGAIVGEVEPVVIVAGWEYRHKRSVGVAALR